MIPKIVSSIRAFLSNEDGPTAVEYGVMLTLIIVVALTAVAALGTENAANMNEIASQMPG